MAGKKRGGTTDSQSKAGPALTWRRARFALALAAITLAVWLPSVNNGFVPWDDDGNFLRNPNYRGLAPANLAWIFTTFFHGHYQPLSWLTLAIDYSLWEMNPAGYHFTNVLLHAISAALFYLVLLELLDRSAIVVRGAGRLEWVALAVTLLWALHPLRVEAVTWITERREVLCGALTLATLLQHLRRRPMWLVTMVAAAAMLAKATAVLLPVLLLLIDFWEAGAFAKTGWTKSLLLSARRQVGSFAAALALSIVAVLAQRESHAMIPTELLPWSGRIALYFYGIGFYVLKTVLPFGLAPLHQGQTIKWELLPFVYWQAAISAVGVIAALGAGIALRRRMPALLLLIVAFLLMVAPVGGLAQSGPQIVAERYTYQPAWVLTLLLAAGGVLAARRKAALARVMTPVTVAVAASLAILCVRQQRFWHDGETLWGRELAVYPDNALAWFHLGRYRTALNPPNLAGAERCFRNAVEREPKLVDSQAALADILRVTGRAAEADDHFRAALAVEPANALALQRHALVLWELKRTDEALTELTRVTELGPTNFAGWSQLAQAQAAAGRYPEARRSFEKALELSHGSIDGVIGLAWFLATAPDAESRDGKRALELVERTRSRSGALDPRLLIVHAAACAETGDFETARRDLEQQLAGARPEAAAELRGLIAQMERREALRIQPEFR